MRNWNEMRNLKTILWGLAAGSAVCAATIWSGPGSGGAFGPGAAWAQARGDTSSHMSAKQRADLMYDLRLDSMSDEDKEALKKSRTDGWKAFLEFLKVNAPNRYDILTKQQMSLGSQQQTRLMQRWLNMEQLKTSQRDMYDLMVQQFTTEDRLIGLAARLLLSSRKHDGNETGIEKEIRAQAFVSEELSLSQRNLRIQNEQRALDQQRTDWQQDTKNQKQLADERAQAIILRSIGGRGAPDAAGRGQNPVDLPPVDVNPNP